MAVKAVVSKAVKKAVEEGGAVPGKHGNRRRDLTGMACSCLRQAAIFRKV